VDHPSDQREEDALCLTFTSEPLQERLELLGRPRLRLAVAADKPIALVVARLCRVSPDGTSTLVTRSALNLTHRDSDEHPSELVPGQRYEIAFDLNVVGQAIPAGDRLRLSLSTTYWPWLWPSPEDVELTVFAGADSVLELPVRPPSEADADLAPFGPPDQAPPLRRETVATTAPYHTVRRQPVSGLLEFEDDPVGATTSVLLDTDLEVSTRYHDLFSIQEHEPLSARVTCERSFGLARGAWRIRVDATSTMTSTATEFQVDDMLEAFEGDRRVFVKTWSRGFPRDLV